MRGWSEGNPRTVNQSQTGHYGCHPPDCMVLQYNLNTYMNTHKRWITKAWMHDTTETGKCSCSAMSNLQKYAFTNTSLYILALVTMQERAQQHLQSRYGMFDGLKKHSWHTKHNQKIMLSTKNSQLVYLQCLWPHDQNLNANVTTLTCWLFSILIAYLFSLKKSQVTSSNCLFCLTNT